jgi:phenylacetate-CoA ligase
MCSLSDRHILEKGFGVRVANEYGCAEMDMLAFEDENFDWIISDENVYLEILDEDNKKVEFGKSGRIILTSLYNKAFPLIRYEVGDVGMVDVKKKINNSILMDLVGRTNDFAILPSGRKVPALTFYYITKSLIQEDFKIKEFIIKQLTKKNFHYEYVSEFELSSDAIVKINKAMELYLEPGLIATFEKKELIERLKAGKFKQFYNLIDVN